MITAVDTNVLLDVLGGDPPYATSSREAIRRCVAEGSIVACEVVWAETAGWFDEPASMERALDRIGLRFDPLTSDTAAGAGSAWRQYRGQGGPRQRLLPDFLVGAHALHQADRLLTRDRGFYRRYFAGVAIVDPGMGAT